MSLTSIPTALVALLLLASCALAQDSTPSTCDPGAACLLEDPATPQLQPTPDAASVRLESPAALGRFTIRQDQQGAYEWFWRNEDAQRSAQQKDASTVTAAEMPAYSMSPSFISSQATLRGFEHQTGSQAVPVEPDPTPTAPSSPAAAGASVERGPAAQHVPGTGDWPAGEQPWSRSLVYTLGGCVMAFGLLLCLIMAWLLHHGSEPDAVLRTFGLPLIVVAAVLLVIIGYGQEQIAPVIGLLGTLAGYLLGRPGGAPAPKQR